MLLETLGTTRRPCTASNLTYDVIIAFTFGVSAFETRVAPRSLRLRPLAFLVRMWRFIERLRFTLPEAVSLNRATAARFVFFLIFVLGFRIFEFRSFVSSGL
jgi:hypothetical protein